VTTILSAARGELVCSPKLAGTLLRRVSKLASERSEHGEARLTLRELEVARLLDVGLSNKQISARLGVELPTVKHHVHHILEKLGVQRRSAAVARLREQGVLPPSVMRD
jgi:DNA-binding NarL/FixJ family response regulator